MIWFRRRSFAIKLSQHHPRLPTSSTLSLFSARDDKAQHGNLNQIAETQNRFFNDLTRWSFAVVVFFLPSATKEREGKVEDTWRTESSTAEYLHQSLPLNPGRGAEDGATQY